LDCHGKLNAASTALAYAWPRIMIDYATLALTHGLIALALWRLLFRADLDSDGAEPRAPQSRWRRGGKARQDGGGDA
jgi:hypothetical protein